jgi:hypothetical protein
MRSKPARSSLRLFVRMGVRRLEPRLDFDDRALRTERDLAFVLRDVEEVRRLVEVFRFATQYSRLGDYSIGRGPGTHATISA